MRAAGTDGRQCFVDAVSAGMRFRCAAHRDNERLRAGKHMPPAALSHTTHGVHCHRLVTEDRAAQVAPVDALGSGAPRLLLRRRHFVASWRWPDDRLAVTACHQVQALADRRGAGVGRDALAPFDVVAEPAHQRFHRNELAD
ncbi:hypothetical protein D3C87_1399060 [compost metagenome]